MFRSIFVSFNFGRFEPGSGRFESFKSVGPITGPITDMFGKLGGNFGIKA